MLPLEVWNFRSHERWGGEPEGSYDFSRQVGVLIYIEIR